MVHLSTSTSLLLAVQIQTTRAGITNWLWSGRDRKLATVPCITGGFVLEFDNDCNFENLKASYATLFNDVNVRRTGCSNTIEQDLSAVLGVAASEMEQKVMDICHEAQDSAYQIPLSHVPGEDASFIQDYYNGRTYWNEHRETLLSPASDGATPAYVLKEEAVRVKNYYDDAETKRFEWPDESASSFDNCQMSAAMCCYAADRQANDNNGDCDDPYDENCLGDANPGDNTDLCMIDLSNAPGSNNIESNGFTFFDGDRNEGEASVHCHGFAWSEDEHDATARYKANNLFFVSMYDHMYKRGYVRNIPGAPMCGCLEQMPVVSRSDCTQVDVTERYRFVRDGGTIAASVHRATIEFNACQGAEDRNNDLLHHIRRLESEGHISTTTMETVERDHILGHPHKCYDRALEAMLEHGYMWAHEPDRNEWAIIDGIGELRPAAAVDDPLYFKEILASRTHPIIRRVCPNCVASHRDIYYRRLTPIPDDMDVLDCMKNLWAEEHNVMGTDFSLHSSYEDAVRGADPWTYCNYDGHVGFPRDCGPGGRVNGNWNRWYGDSNQYNGDIGFYVEANPPFPSNNNSNNVARGKLAYQMSTGYGGRPDKAVDGNFSGYWWPDESITHTRKGDRPWLEVFLENDAVEVDFVALFNRRDHRPERLSDVTVDLLDGPAGNVVATRTHVGAVRGGMAHFQFDGESAQAVRVTVAGSATYLSLAEVYVGGREAGAPIANVALGKPASQATTYGDLAAARAVDGRTTGDWGDRSIAHTSWSSDGWWMVDLEGSYHILQVVVFNRSDCCQDRMKNLKIEVLAAGGDVIAARGLADGAFPDPCAVFEFNVSGGAAVRLTADTNVLNIAEVVVLSDTVVVVPGQPMGYSSAAPTTAPTRTAVGGSTEEPSSAPSVAPSASLATSVPSAAPAAVPEGTETPSVAPSALPTGGQAVPSAPIVATEDDSPSASPSAQPTVSKITTTAAPVEGTESSSSSPSASPSGSPTSSPSSSVSSQPTATAAAVQATSAPVVAATEMPSVAPSALPTSVVVTGPPPSASPTVSNTEAPSASPSAAVTSSRSDVPSNSPSASPSVAQTGSPSTSPSDSPSVMQTESPTTSPSDSPSVMRTESPTSSPSGSPSVMAQTESPTAFPSGSPSVMAQTAAGSTIAPSVAAVDARRTVLAPGDSHYNAASVPSSASRLATPASAAVLSPADRLQSGISTNENVQRDVVAAESKVPKQVNIVFEDEERATTINSPKLGSNPSTLASVILSPADRL